MNVIFIPFFLLLILFSCFKDDYSLGNAKIINPSDKAVFHSKDTINFNFEGSTSGVMMEFDRCFFTLENTSNGEIVLTKTLGDTIAGIDFKDKISYIPIFKDSTCLQATAEYWREDATKPDKSHQIKFFILP